MISAIEQLAERDPDIWDKFCGNCMFLDPTENAQDCYKRDLGISKGDHWCSKFNVQVYHKLAHPHIYKCEECLKDGRF